MRTIKSWRSLGLLIPVVVVFVAGCSTMQGWMGGGTKLSGSQEVPPITTSAAGTSSISVKDDHTVSGTVSVSGMTATAAHIHEAAMGKNGPVVVPLKKSGDGFEVPAGTKLSDAQYSAYKAGDLYVNVHSAAHPGGEIRAQLKP